MSSNQKKKKPPGTGSSGGVGKRTGSASKNVINPKQPGRNCMIKEHMDNSEQLLLDQASELRAKIIALEEENNGLKDENRKLKEEKTGVDVADRSDLEKQLRDLKSDNENMKGTVKEQNTEILKLQTELEGAKEQNRKSEESFRNKLSQKESHLNETKLQLAMCKNRLTNMFGQRTLSTQNVSDQQSQAQNKNFEKELKEKDEAMKQMLEKCKNLEQQIDRLKLERDANDKEEKTAPPDSTLTDLTQDLNKAKQKCEETESEVKELQNQVQSKEKEIQELNRKMAEATTENNSLKDKLSKLSNNEGLKAEKQITETNEEQLKRKIEEVESLKTELETLKRNKAQQLESKSEEVASLKKELENLKKNEAQQLKNKNEETDSLKKELETLKRDNAKLKDGKQNTEVEVEKHLKEIQSLKDEIKKLQKLKTAGDKTPSTSANTDKDLKQKYEQTHKELNDTKAEISELKNRLSQAVGAKIMDNNPNITDLSDENRPTKLAEKYSELYDNEWTDAYEEVENELPNEQDVIKHLYQRLLDVFDFCQKSSEEYSKSLKSCALGLPSLTVESGRPMSGKFQIGVTHVRQLKELKKSFSPFLVEDVFQNYVKNRKLKLEKKAKTAAFIRKCVEICWLMSNQDPPVILDTRNVKGPFDGDRYRTYTKTGKTVDFFVWPPMLLHKDGPLLSKGVAQAK